MSVLRASLCFVLSAVFYAVAFRAYYKANRP